MLNQLPEDSGLVFVPTKDEHVVLYHKNCNDGIASAWVAYQHYGENARYIAFQYGDRLPADIIGRHVVMIDVSVPQEVINQLLDKKLVESIMLIDHHITVIKQLQGGLWCRSVEQYENRRNDHDRYFYLTDAHCCGAALAWSFFKTEEGYGVGYQTPLYPPVINHIQDYDLWRRELPETDAINAWLANGPRTIERFHSMTKPDGSISENVIEGGTLLINAENTQIRDLIDNCVEYGYYGEEQIVAVNAPYVLRNRLADELLKEGWAFVVVYSRQSTRTIISVRSSGYDVTPVAERYNGGGHKTAAAFKISHDRLAGREILDLFQPPSFWQRLRRAWSLLTNPSLTNKETRRVR